MDKIAESQPTSHSDLMNLRAKGKKLHRRTQSHTTFTLNEVVNRKNNSEEFFQEMLQTNNVLTGDITQKVLDAVNRETNEKEVIIDDIDEIPNTGIIVPQRMSNSLNNPLNNNLQRRALMMRNNMQATNSQFKKIDMLAQVRNIDDITGLGTIHEKRNSMESIDTENMNKKSPNMTISGSSSQNVSKPVSRTHSKHPSLDFRVGHSNSSSIDFRPMHSKQSSGDMWPIHSKQPSADFKPTHAKQSSADFRSLGKETLMRVEKEIDVVKYNLMSPKTVKVSDTIQLNAANMDYFDKRNRFITEMQKSTVEKTIKRGNTVPDQNIAKPTKSEESKPKPKLTSTLDCKERPKLSKTSASSKHRRTYSGNVGKGGEITIPQEDFASTPGFSTFKNPREYTSYDTMPTPSNKVHYNDFNLDLVEGKKDLSDDSMKKLIISVIESFAHEKSQLEEKIQMQDKQIQMQDKQIKELISVLNKYQEEMKHMKTRSEVKTSPDSDKKASSTKGEGGLNILTSTEGSVFDSSLTESSGFLSNKDGRIKNKSGVANSTPHGQARPHTAKGNERKSPGLGNKTELTKKVSLGAKKPVTKKV